VSGLQPQARTALFFALAGVLAGAISAPIRSGWGAFLLALLIYILAAPLARSVLKLQQSEFPISKILSSGIGPFFLMWLISWIWVYTALL